MQRQMWSARRMAMARRNDFGLFAWVPDKQLTTADVQTLAQAMLLRHGNHTWKVANVAANQDNTISFAFTTADGGVRRALRHGHAHRPRAPHRLTVAQWLRLTTGARGP